MRYWTYLEIKTKVQKDLDIEQEEFVTSSELMAYCNEAIDEAEAEIHTVYEDYFLNYATINLVASTNTYALPTDIYANKIRGIIFKSGSEMYPLKRIKETDKFEDIMRTNEYDTSAPYRYILTNPSSAGIQLYIVPTIRETITAGLTIWYIRNATRMTADADICDIPEFTSFVMQYMKMRVYEKEGNPNLNVAVSLLEQQRNQMRATLSNKIIDGDNEVEKDLTFYQDMV